MSLNSGKFRHLKSWAFTLELPLGAITYLQVGGDGAVAHRITDYALTQALCGEGRSRGWKPAFPPASAPILGCLPQYGYCLSDLST